ncbi:uncharacterized protein LOC127724072 isoform X2 [Mytilus californianus]|nr:uncharacterized protein LOC127724072 isoform X2 [Mytilus californianus]
MQQQDITGGSLAICFHGKLIYTQGYGVANSGLKALSTSLFRLASISKTITAVGILKLVEDGKLKLDQKIFGQNGILKKYKPSGKGDKKLLKITVRHLLQHSGGWDRDQVGDAVFWKLPKKKRVDPYSDEALIKYMLSWKLQFTPGKRHAYSNLGYLILGKVMEAVTGMPYINYIQEICRSFNVLPGYAKQIDSYPLEVKYFNNRENILEPSVFEEEGSVPAQYGGFKMEGTESYGGLVMSVVELLALFNQINSGDRPLVAEECFRLMIERPSYELGDQWYGLGLDVQNNGLSWGHTGAMEGTSTTVHCHKSGLSWALFFNTWAKDMDLDGLMKYGLSKILHLPLWTKSLSNNEYVVHSEEQIVYLLLPLYNLQSYVKSFTGYYLSQVDITEYKDSLCVNAIWKKSTSRHLVFINKNIGNIHDLVQDCNLCNAYVYMLESYCYENDIYYIIGLRESYKEVQQEICVNLNAAKHLIRMKKMKNSGFTMRAQSVAGKLDNLFVSSVFDKENKLNFVSWLQITMENFVFELGKNSRKNLAPVYVNCFSIGGEPFVSAIWIPGEKKQYLQRHDVSIYGFLYELQESVKNQVSLEKICSYYNDGVLNFLAVWSQ